MISVVKLGGRVQSDPKLVDTIASVYHRMKGELCIIHGGGDEISTLQRALGRQPSFLHGRRITSAEDVDLVRMVLSGSANKRLVASLSKAGVPAVGISGEDGSLLGAEPLEGFGRSGRPYSANPTIIMTLLDSGFVPVISPVAFDMTRHGEALNVNGDDAAAVIAGELGAELLMISDVPGVKDSDGAVMRSLGVSQVDVMVSDGTINSGMRAKLEAGFDALRRGALDVRITGLDGLYSEDAGTELSLTPSLK